MLLGPLLAVLVAAPARAADAGAPPPDVITPTEPAEHRFNLTYRGGEPADSLAKALKHFYYNLEGENAIRDGIRYQEKAVLGQLGGRLDPAQGAVYASTLRCEAALAKLYALLRGVALDLERPKTEARQAVVSRAMESAEVLLRTVPSLVEEAGRWHAAAYRAAGGGGPADLTGRALGNGQSAAAGAMDEARGAVSAWASGAPQAAARADAKEAGALPELADFHAQLSVGELPASLPGGRSRPAGGGADRLRRRLAEFSFDGPDRTAPH